jgi:hypothetical protein
MATQAYVFVYATPGKVEESAKAIAKTDWSSRRTPVGGAPT